MVMNMKIAFCKCNQLFMKTCIEALKKKHTVEIVTHEDICLKERINAFDLIIDFSKENVFHTAVISLCSKKPVMINGCSCNISQINTLKALCNHYQCTCISLSNICCSMCYIFSLLRPLFQVFEEVKVQIYDSQFNEKCISYIKETYNIKKIECIKISQQNYPNYKFYLKNKFHETLQMEYQTPINRIFIQDIVNIVDEISLQEGFLTYQQLHVQ